MDTSLYIKLSLVMGLEYAIWGAWLPVLASRLLGPLKFSGKQTGWIYATLPLACIVSPLLAGQLADKWVNAEWILAASHLIGAVLLLIAATQTRFVPLFAVMLVWSVFYAATMPLVNAVLFTNVTDGSWQGRVFLWAPVGWALVGYFLTGWRWIFKTAEKGRDCLFLAAILSLVMVGACLILPPTAPAKAGVVPIAQALSMLGDINFLIFVVVSLVVAGLMQFYFMGSGQLLIDSGFGAKNVSAIMAIAQAVQAIATYFWMAWLISRVGYKWTLTIGAVSWMVLYFAYVLGSPRSLLVVVQPLHGLAYVFFVIVGQIFANSVAPAEIQKSVQGLIFAATTGLGMFLGTQFAGVVMDMSKREGKFNWRKVFAVPAVITLVSVLVLVVLFKT